MAKSTCVAADCQRIEWARGLCGKHYQRQARLGTVELTRRATTEELFWAKVDKTSGSCWLWCGHVMKNGYGQFSHGARPATKELAHRFAYRITIGAVPDGLHLDHLCRNRRCVNPDHLEPVTQAENNRRAAAALRKTHCIHGHPLAGANLYLAPTGQRVCRACRVVRGRAFRERAKGA